MRFLPAKKIANFNLYFYLAGEFGELYACLGKAFEGIPCLRHGFPGFFRKIRKKTYKGITFFLLSRLKF
jgi:hypothetical protein